MEHTAPHNADAKIVATSKVSFEGDELIGSAARPVPMAVREIVGPLAEGLGYVLVGIELAREGHRLVLWLYIDGENGVGIDDCAKVSREASAALDVEDPIPQAYELRVSSPGLDRPLMSAAQFAAQVGESAAVTLSEPLDGRKRFSGEIIAVHPGAARGDADSAHVELVGSTLDIRVDGEIFTLAIADIQKARLKYAFDAPSTKGRKK
ncbi:MAG: ribosome maturation factor RimP [Bradymonadia bacterium]